MPANGVAALSTDSQASSQQQESFYFLKSRKQLLLRVVCRCGFFRIGRTFKPQAKEEKRNIFHRDLPFGPLLTGLKCE
jgi:hypothetical protein